MKLGFIGLGVMGKPMCKNLLKAGFTVAVHNRSRGAVEELTKLGARPANSPKEVAENSGVVVTCLPSPVEVRQVALGEDGVVHGMPRGGVLVDCTTVDPDTARSVARELEKRGLHLLEAPISGGPARAENATLTFMVGGEPAVFERCRPVLSAMGRNLFHVGPVGAGSAVKLVNQILCALNFLSVGEALVWGVKAGARPEAILEVVRTSVGNSVVFEHAVPEILRGEFGPSFQTWLYRKDLELVLGVASRLGVPMLLSSLAHQLFRLSEEMGNGRKDAASIVKVLEHLSGTKVTPDSPLCR